MPATITNFPQPQTYYRDPPEPWLTDAEVIDISEYFSKTVAALARDKATEEPTSYINDAEIWGVMSDEVANLPIILSIAKSRDVREWATQPAARFEAVFKGIFSKHVVGKKDGKSFVTGSLGQGSKRRTKTNVLANYIMGLDIDNGASMEQAFQKVRSLGLTAIFYTTHSHGTTIIDIAYDKFHRWATKNSLSTDPSTDLIRRFMREETIYVPDVCDGAEYVKKHHEDGMKIIVKVRPLDKFRVLFPLAEPYVYADQDGAHKDVIAAWESKVLGMGRSIGVEADRKARDPSRLFFLPRHAKGSTNHRIMLTCGKLLSFEDIPAANVRDRLTNDPFDQAAHSMGGKGTRERLISPTIGLDLGAWAKDHAHHFDIASVFRDHCSDRIRVEQSIDKLTVECPFDDDHSNPGDPEDPGTFVQSAGMDAESFSFHCSHAGCADRHRMHFMQKAMQEGWFPDEVLTDRAYLDDVDDAPEAPDHDERKQESASAGFGESLRKLGYRLDTKENYIYIAGKEGAPVCQAFEIVEHFEDAHGDNATFFLRFESMGRIKTARIERGDLWNRATVISQLAAMNFRIEGNGDTTLELLRKVSPRVNGHWVDRRGWHGDAYLTVGGETIKPEGSTTQTLRMLESNWKDFQPMGTLEGWREAVAPVWEGNAEGHEHFAIALMMGFAGPIFGRCHPYGFRMLSLHGPTSRGKSLACKLLASVSGPAINGGCYITLRATSNGIEATLPDVSGHPFALDEGQHMKAEHANEMVFMLEDGAGKTAANQNRSAKEVRHFGGGLVLMANEKPWAQKLIDAKVDVSPGFDARVLDINVASVRDYPKNEATELTNKLYGVVRHNGWALPMIVNALLSADPERIMRQIDRLTTALVGKDAKGLESRAMETLAWVWLGGILGKRLGLIPAGFSTGRVMRWARENRVADASQPVSERVLSTLRTSISRRRKVDIYRWETFDPDALGDGFPDDVERVNRPWAGFLYIGRNGEELIVNADALRGMAGNVCSETEIAQYLRNAGFLRMSGKNLYHDTLPMRDGKAERIKNYRIVSAFYLAPATDEPESSTEAA